MRIERADNFMNSLGFETYRVGGSVRDEIMGRRPKDADYVVRGASLSALRSALTSNIGVEVSKLNLRTGAHVGWRANKRGLGLIEICLPRAEVSTGDGRHAFEIVCQPDLPITEDSKRRDFTFNALYKLLPDGPVADPTSQGLYDLQHKLIRTTHHDSFRDDPLRTLRALRFVSTLGFDLSQEAYIEMVAHADAVTGLTQKGVSGTVFDELSKLLMGDNPATALRLARDTGVLRVVLPELAKMLGFDQGSRYHDLTTDEHTFEALTTAARCDASLRVRWALLFHDAGKPGAAWVGTDGRKHYYAKTFPGDPEVRTCDHEEISDQLWRETAQRLNVPKALRKDVSVLIQEHMVSTGGKLKPAKVRRGRVKFGDELLRDLYMHRLCDLSGKGLKRSVSQMGRIAQYEELRQQAKKAEIPASVKELQVSGKDALALGLDGRDIGTALYGVLDEVVVRADELALSRDWQLQRLEAQKAR